MRLKERGQARLPDLELTVIEQGDYVERLSSKNLKDLIEVSGSGSRLALLFLSQ